MKGVNRHEGDPNYDLFRLALKSTASRLYPNYANVDWSGNAGYDVNDPSTYFSTMGCRTANGWDVNGFGQKKDGRGNICPVTIIMPTLAMQAKEIVDKVKNMGYRVVLATNPVFPKAATEKRLKWVGLSPQDFELCTTYENTSYYFSTVTNFYESLELLLDFVQTPCFIEESVESEKLIIEQEIMSSLDRAGSVAFHGILKNLFKEIK